MSAHPPPVVGDVGLLSFTHTQLWAAQKLVVNILWFLSNEEFVKPYLPVFSVLSLFNITAATHKRTRPLKAGIIAGSLYRIYVTLLLSFQKEMPGMLVYADLPTFLLVFLPELLILDWRLGVPLYTFAFSHAGVTALLYTMAGMHGILMSICRAFGFHGICFFLYLAIRLKAHSYYTRASEAPVSIPPKANKQLQMDADNMQQHKLQKLHEQQQQQHRPMWIPAKTQQAEEMQREPAERPLVGQTSDTAAAAAAAHMAPLSMSNQGVPSETWATAGSAAAVGGSTAAGSGAAAAGVKRSPAGMSQPQPPRLGLNSLDSEIQSALARQLLPKKHDGSAPWSVGDHSSRRSSSKSSSTYSSSIDSPQNSSRFIKVHQGVPHLCLHLAAPASTLVPKGLADALRAKTEASKRSPYVSKLSQSRSPPQTTAHYLQAACRLAVKITGPTPDNVPRGSLANFQGRLQRYQRLMPLESPSVRAGCLVISFGAKPSGQCCTLQQLRDGVLAVASEWACENDLLPPGEDRLLTVQACYQSTWGSVGVNPGCHDYPPEHSIITLHQPFLETIASSPEDYEAPSCRAGVTLMAPPHLTELRGWQGAADAPEDLPAENGVRNRSLCCMASLDGQYLRVSIEQCSHNSDGEWLAQVRVSLPKTMDDAAANVYPKKLVLELWAAGKLACSYAAVVVPRCYAGALVELPVEDEAGWEQEESLVFVCDLVMWMHFFIQATCSRAAGEGQHMLIDTFAGDSAGQADTEGELMVAVGLDLLEHCLGQGMHTLAGMLENTLAIFCTSPWKPLGAQTPAAEQLDDALDGQEFGSPHRPSSADAGHSTSPAKQLESAQRLPEGVCHKNSAPSSSDSMQQPLLAYSAAGVAGHLHSGNVTSNTCSTCAQSGNLPSCPHSGTFASGSNGGGDSGDGVTAGAGSVSDAASGAPATYSSSASCPIRSKFSSHPSAPASPTAATVAAGKQALKSAVARFSPMTAPAEEEDAYQAWKHVQIAHLFSCWCMIQVLAWVVMVIRSLLKGGEQGRVLVSAELGVMMSQVPIFMIAAFFMSKAGSHKELVHVTTLIIRAGFSVVAGLDVVPISPSLVPLVSSRAEVPGEIFLNAVAEQPRVLWMLPIRLVHTVGYGLWYSRYGVAAPWFQAIALNACALAVSLVMDARYRRSFALWTLSNAKRSGKADGSDHKLCDEVPGCRQGKVEPPKAGSSTVPKCKQV